MISREKLGIVQTPHLTNFIIGYPIFFKFPLFIVINAKCTFKHIIGLEFWNYIVKYEKKKKKKKKELMCYV